MLEEDENGAFWNSEYYNDAGERIKDYNVTSDDIKSQVWDSQRELVRMVRPPGSLYPPGLTPS